MRIQLLLLILSLPIVINATELDYGLFIKSYPYKTSEMSNLVLENGEEIKLDGDITLSFDAYVRNDNVFGNIFRILTDKNENIDLLITVGVNDKRFPIFVVNESVHPMTQEIVCDKWIRITLTLSPKNNTITIKYDDEEQTIQYPVSKIKSFRTAFGLCLFDGYMLTNVASVNLKDIRIFKREKLFRYWKLEKHRHEVCYDSVANVPATILNPYWLIDDHVTWNKIFTLNTTTESPSVTYNSTTDDFYIVNNSEKITVFNTASMKKSEIKVNSGLFAANAPNQLMYIPQRNTLLSYNLDEQLFSFFSFETNSWSNHTPNVKEHSYWNNSIVFNPADESLLSFGGYGFYKYNNELLKQYPWGNKAEEKTQLTEISPRYSLATALVNNILYVFGGRGNKSGRQELFPKNFYDFYAVNLHTTQVNKLWEVPSVEGGDFMPSENLIYDAEKKCFYMFSTQAGATLLKITANTPGFEAMSLPIHTDIEAQYIYTNLYYSPKQKKLFGLFNKTDVNNNAEITIYSLNYPPIPVTDLIQPVPQINKSNWSIYQALIAIVVLVVIAGIYFSLKRRKGKKKPEAPQNTAPAFVNTQGTLNAEITEQKDFVFPQTYDFNKQCICFLGGFHVRDKDGEDITSIFTPTLKLLLILLILYTVENKRGITGKKMLQLLWSDKNESSARNNRNVYLSKLRTILERIGTVDIINDAGFWSIKFGDEVLCDYSEAMNYLSMLRDKQMTDDSEYYKLLELLLRGTLLPNTEIDWIDRFKSDFSNLTIDTLSALLTTEEGLDSNLKYRMADTLFQHDFINEVALHTKCKTLSESGKMGLAKAFYDNYCKEYYNLLGTKYKYSLSEVINGVESEK